MLEKVSDFSTRFKQALEIRDIKAIDISNKTGISESTLSQYKGGYSKPKDKRLAMIADVLDVDPAWLMGLNVPMRNPLVSAMLKHDSALSNEYIKHHIKEAINLSESEYELIIAFRRADTVTQNNILKLLDIEIKEKNADVG